jgi:transposase
VEDWAEIRRLHRAEGVPIKEIARRLGIARNTVRAALRADQVPRRERGPRVRLAYAVENQLRLLLVEWPTMPATVIAERIGCGIRWPRSKIACARSARGISESTPSTECLTSRVSWRNATYGFPRREFRWRRGRSGFCLFW